MDRTEKACVWEFPYKHSSGNARHIKAQEVTSAKRTASQVHLNRWLRFIHVRYKPGPRKALKKTKNAVGAILRCLLDFLDPAANFFVINNVVVGEHITGDRQTLHLGITENLLRCIVCRRCVKSTVRRSRPTLVRIAVE